MQFDFSKTPPRDRYKVLTALVVPRPIALVTTLSPAGVINAAPYSFFNVFSQDPAICVLGIERQGSGRLKNTAEHIEAKTEFCVNLVDESIAEAMNVCAVDFPDDVSELPHAGLTPSPSYLIETPGIAEAPASLECRLHSAILLGSERRLILGEIVAVQIKDEIYDLDSKRIRADAYKPIGRLHGNSYCSTQGRFEMVRQSHATWKANNA